MKMKKTGKKWAEGKKDGVRNVRAGGRKRGR